MTRGVRRSVLRSTRDHNPVNRATFEVPMNLLAALSALRGLAVSCFILGSLVASLPVTLSTQFQSVGLQGHWSTKARLPTERAEVAVAAVNGMIYVLGGQTLGSPASKLTQEYDSATDRWRD